MRSASLARSRAARGAGVPGWPTSMWITSCPLAFRAFAAAITSITMKGSIALRVASGRGKPSDSR